MKRYKPTDSGRNKTGMLAHPLMAGKAIEAGTAKPSLEGDETTANRVRGHYIKESGPIGSMPHLKIPSDAPPGIDKDLMSFYLCKLGARLAFERTGVRLYEMLIAKLSTRGGRSGPIKELIHIRNEELEHFELLQSILEKLSADPTAVTPEADVAGTASAGIVNVIADPRTSLEQCLEALLMAELADNDGWMILVEIAEKMGYEDEAWSFREAFDDEQEHLGKIRGWLREKIVVKVQRAAA